jgi:hypothetical protein
LRTAFKASLISMSSLTWTSIVSVSSAIVENEMLPNLITSSAVSYLRLVNFEKFMNIPQLFQWRSHFRLAPQPHNGRIGNSLK